MTHPDEQIVAKHRDVMNLLANALDSIFNGDATGAEQRTCFVLLVAPFGAGDGRVNYISNGVRADVVTMMKETIARFEGQPEIKGSA
jgi:hypothetical protein